MVESRQPEPQAENNITKEQTEGNQDLDKVCGVSRIQIEQFLTLIRDNYKKADKATFFLEQRTGVVNLQGITNVRDVLSHLVTLLNPDTPEDKRHEQLGNAEEHLRRAIIEPYEIALNELTVKFELLYKNYKTRVLPIQAKHTTLQNAPNAVSVEATLEEIRDHTSQGRAGKAKNLWDPEWEQGVANFIDAYDKLFKLYTNLEGHWNNYEQIRRDRKSTWLHISAISIGVIGIVIALLFTLIPRFGEALRAFLHIS